MKRLAAALILCGSQVAAFEPMALDDCRAGWRGLVSALPMSEPDHTAAAAAEAVSHRVTDDGWCRLSGADPALDGAMFATLDWQAEGLADALARDAAPDAVRLRIEGLRPWGEDPVARDNLAGAAPLRLTATMRLVPDARQLLIEELRVRSPVGDDLRITAVFDRVDLSSPSMAQMSMGSVALSAMNIRTRMNGWVESLLLPNLDIELQGDDAAIRELVISAASGLPEGVWVPGALSEVEAFAATLPAPRGDLEIGLKADGGLGIVQFVMRGLGALNGSGAATALMGVTLDATWAPDADQTE